MSMRFTSLILSLVALAVACGDENDSPEFKTTREQLSWSHGVVGFDGTERTQLNAEFYRAVGVERVAVFAAFETWIPDRTLDVDTCSSFFPLNNNDFSVELLDVGPLVVERDTGEFDRVESRRLPDYFAQIHGVIYQHDFVGIDASLAFSTTDEVESLSFQPRIPADPNAEFVVNDTFLTVRWDTFSDAGIYLDIETKTGQQTHCRLEDDGLFEFPLAWLAGGEVTLRRANVETISSTEFDRVDIVSTSTSRFSMD